MRVLVSGGAGYIGSHAVKRLRAAAHEVIVVDNLFRGHKESIPADVTFYEMDIRETEALTDVLKKERIDCVMHFAALAYVGESVHEPMLYYQNNTIGSISLLQAMDAAGIKRLVFSSTCATYGEPEQMPIVETTPQKPINPYGQSKLMVEQVLRDYHAAHPDFSYAALRYFNVAGSAKDASIGEHHEPETHVIPLLLFAAMGKRERFTIFGDDYATADGTCIRDYIHVEDLVDAHVQVMDALQPGDERHYNLGIGRGVSVHDLVAAAKKVSGVDFEVVMGERRAGDPPSLYCNPQKIRDELGWSAQCTNLEEMVASAWAWFQAHPDGYLAKSVS